MGKNIGILKSTGKIEKIISWISIKFFYLLHKWRHSVVTKFKVDHMYARIKMK